MAETQGAHANSEELLRQQTALAKFGEFTLRSEDRSDILQEATRLVAEGLHTQFAKILELQEGSTMLVRAGVGWRAGGRRAADHRSRRRDGGGHSASASWNQARCGSFIAWAETVSRHRLAVVFMTSEV